MNGMILVPYPALGHATLITKLALALHVCSYDPILVIPDYLHRLVASNIPQPIEYVPIPDGIDNDTIPQDFFAVQRVMEENMSAHIKSLVKDQVEVAFMVVDLIASWTIEVADRCNVPVAGFFTAMLDVYEVIATIPETVRDVIISKLGLPRDEKKVYYFVMNSFPHDNIENNERDGDHIRPRIFLVGPLGLVAVTKNPIFWEEDESCLSWLNLQEPGSVIYISFGSWVSPIGEANVNNLALSLKKSRKPYCGLFERTGGIATPNTTYL